MDESLKDRIILILAILTVIFLIGNISSCGGVLKLKGSHNKEMARRLDLEEEMEKVKQKDTVIESKLNNLIEDLEKEKAEHNKTKVALEQEMTINAGLKEELEKMTRLKEELEDDLKEALVNTKKAKDR